MAKKFNLSKGCMQLVLCKDGNYYWANPCKAGLRCTKCGEVHR